MFSKVLVANRGEIAVRAFRAATELGAKTVAVFPHEDRKSEHVLKADEAYQIGEVGHPVRAYLDHEDIVRVAVECGADAIYPGYGFMSENPDLAEACAAHGDHLRRPAGLGAAPHRQQGPRHRRRQGGRAADPRQRPRRAPTSTRSSRPPRSIGFPVFVKAVAGGGGRGMRRVERPRRPARGARGRPARGRVRLRRPDRLPRAGRGQPPPHRGADPRRRSTGNVIHLFERDCSVQRRHQKVVEIAPAPNLDPATARRGCAPTPCASRERSATSTPAPSSSSSARTAATSSSR